MKLANKGHVKVFDNKGQEIAAFYSDDIYQDVRQETIFPKGKKWYYIVKDETVIFNGAMYIEPKHHL